MDIPEMDNFLAILQEGANVNAADALSSSDSEAEEVKSPAKPYFDPPDLLEAQVNAVTRLLSNESPGSAFLEERQLLPEQNAHKLYTAGQANTVIETCLNEMVTTGQKMGADGVHAVPSQAAIDMVGALLASPLFNVRWAEAERRCLHTKLMNRAHYLFGSIRKSVR